MYALQIIQRAYEKYKHRRFAMNAAGTVVGIRCEDGRYIPMAAAGIDGRWYSVPTPVLANGQPMVAENDWQEVPPS